MIATVEAQCFNLKAYHEQQKTRDITACFRRDVILGYITDSLGHINRTEIGQLAQQLYLDTAADKPRPISTVLKAAGLTRESDTLHYLRSFRGILDQIFVTTLRSTHGHDILMSRVALEYTKEEMEAELDATPWHPEKPMRSVVDWLAGEGPARPLMLDLFHLESQGYVNINRNDNQEIILPTHLMDATADELEAIIDTPLISNRKTLLVAGKYETRVITKP